MQVPELKQLMKTLMGYSRGTKHEIINKVWMLAGALPDVVMECEFSRDSVHVQQRANANCGSPEAEEGLMVTLAVHACQRQAVRIARRGWGPEENA